MSGRAPRLSVLLFPFISCCPDKVLGREEVCVFPPISLLSIATGKNLLFDRTLEVTLRKGRSAGGEVVRALERSRSGGEKGVNTRR